MKILTEEEAYVAMASYCSKSEHCRSEIESKLRHYGMSDLQIDHVIKRLITERFIDEERYAKAFVHDKYVFAGWGVVKIRYALRVKRIEPVDIDNALHAINREEYLSILKNIVEKKNENLKNNGKYERQNKVIHFAMNKGFELDDILLFIKDNVF